MPDSFSNKELLALARKAIEVYLTTGNHLDFKTEAPDLTLKRGCFITLKKMGQLRGCVGTFDADKTLYENIARMAPAAATQDPRFPPVTKDELAHIRIEISVLGELEKVNTLEEIKLGTHGIYVKLGAKSGTFLPEVAVEQKWSVEEFVTYCAREKARLTPAEVGQAEIFRYSVQKFKEKD